MPLVDFSNPEYMRFFTETCEKTAQLRQKWNQEHWDQVQKAAILKREDKGLTDNDVLKVPMLGGLAAVTRDHVSAARNRYCTRPSDGEILGISSIRKGHSIPDVGLGDPKEDPRLARPDTDLSLDPLMRPIDPKQKEILYKPRPECGRSKYIESRNRMNPEDKFYFPESSGWLYGWRLKDSSLDNRPPLCPRKCVLTRDGMSRSGPQPDPDYYQDSGAQVANKCGI